MALLDLEQVLAAACPIYGVASSGRIDFRPEATAEQMTDASEIASDWDFTAGTWRRDTPRAIAAARESAISAIDSRSAELIGQGLIVNGGAPISLSLAAQTNLLNIAVAMQMGALQLPQDISRLDGRAYTIKDAADAQRVARLAGGRIKSVLDGGRELRAAVLLATTQDEIDAVVDERT